MLINLYDNWINPDRIISINATDRIYTVVYLDIYNVPKLMAHYI